MTLEVSSLLFLRPLRPFFSSRAGNLNFSLRPAGRTADATKNPESLYQYCGSDFTDARTGGIEASYGKKGVCHG
jgi:hypothetical protein